MHSISVFIWKSISGGVCSTWNTKLKSSPLQKLCLWGRWQLLLTKYPKVSFEVKNIWMLSSILFWSQERLSSNWRSLLQRKKIRNIQIQAEVAPLFLWWGCTSAFSQSSGMKSLPVEIGFISVKVEFQNMLRGEVQQLKGLLNVFWQSGSVWRARKALWNSVLFWILPCLPDLRKGSHCRKLPLMADLSKSTW